jgi:hypothetical protein
MHEKVVFIGSGKLGFPQQAMLALALGCDLINVAREAMLSIGCIQAQECHTGHCPTGVATQSEWLMGGLDPTLKAARLANYLITLRKEMLPWARVRRVHPALVPLDSLRHRRRVFRFPPDGGDRSRLADVENAQYAGLALDVTHAYFANYTEAGSVARVEKSGDGEVEILASDETYPAGVVVAGDAVYYAVLGADRVRRVPKDGGAVADVATDQRTPRLGLATSETHLFWVTEGDAPMRLWRAPLAGGPAELVGESPSTASWAVTLVVDATHVYFPTPDCQIVRLPHASGAPRALNVLAFSPAAGCPGQIAGDATHLYYTSMTGVFRVAKTAF